jgi:hypothetical protein
LEKRTQSIGIVFPLHWAAKHPDRQLELEALLSDKFPGHTIHFLGGDPSQKVVEVVRVQEAEPDGGPEIEWEDLQQSVLLEVHKEVEAFFGSGRGLWPN